MAWLSLWLYDLVSSSHEQALRLLCRVDVLLAGSELYGSSC